MELTEPPGSDGRRNIWGRPLVRRSSLLIAVAILAFAPSAQAASAITAAAIATGRLYVIGTTDQPHTSVSLDGTFTADSDDKGKFQFELVYYPVGCIVRATIGNQTLQSKVEQCGEICEPMVQARASSVSKPSSSDPSARQGSAALAPPGQPQRSSQAEPQAPQTTSALAPSMPAVQAPPVITTTEPIPHPPLPPPRPTDLMQVAERQAAPEPVLHRLQSRKQRRATPLPAQQETPDDRSTGEPPDAPENTDVY